jgi:mycofactocin biosynthesis protein MftB
MAGSDAATSFDAGRPYEKHPQVAIRRENFGALAYHYGNRRLVFLKSRALVALVTALEAYPSASAAVEAHVPAADRARYVQALARLAGSGVIDAA